MEAPSKGFLLFFLLSDWLKLNHLKSRMECGFSDIFSRHICSTVAETIRVANYAASFGAKICSENHIWSCWDDARSVEPTTQPHRAFWIFSRFSGTSCILDIPNVEKFARDHCTEYWKSHNPLLTGAKEFDKDFRWRRLQILQDEAWLCHL